MGKSAAEQIEYGVTLEGLSAMYPRRPSATERTEGAKPSPRTGGILRPASAAFRRRLISLATGLGIGGTLIAVLLARSWYRLTAPGPPAVDLTGVDVRVAKAVADAQSRVERDRLSAKSWGALGEV